MELTSERTSLSNVSDGSKDMSCPKPSDVKFTISSSKRNLASASNSNILRIGSGESDDDFDGGIKESKRQRLSLLKNGQMIELGQINKTENDLVIPVVMQKDWRTERLLQLKNEGKLDEEGLAKLELLTESASPAQKGVDKVGGEISEPLENMDADYDSVPIELFGLAVLRGCGWREGEGIGKTNKKVVPLRISSRRPKGLGLGASTVSNSMNNLNVLAEKLSILKEASPVKITAGIYRDLYGRIESFDEDNASVIVRLAVSDRNVRVSHYAVISVTDEEYERKRKKIKAGLSHGDDAHLNDEIEMKDYNKRMSSQEKSYEMNSDVDVKPNRKGMWARPELKVRFIDKKFKNGKLYNEKVRILDAADRENCTVEDSCGNKYFQISEHWLETVIPKTKGAKLMIVNGPLHGNIAVLEGRDKKKHMVIARLLTTDEIVNMCFDDVCEYLGCFDDF